jgi:hypothetical protein
MDGWMDGLDGWMDGWMDDKVKVKWVPPVQQIRFLMSQVPNKFETIGSLEHYIINKI